MGNNLNKFLIFSLLIGIVFSGIFAIKPNIAFAQAEGATCNVSGIEGTWVWNSEANTFVCVRGATGATVDTVKGVGALIIEQSLKPVVGFVANLLLTTASFFTGVAGVVLNASIYYTIIKVADNYANIPAINEAWKVLRDLANMGFIFILLYAAIKTILGQGEDNQKLIVRVVMVAILINFSMFFTRIIIDISNVLAITFYEAIAPPGSLSSALGTGSIWHPSQWGLSNAFMQALNLQSLYNSANVNIGNTELLTVGIMGSILMFIASFVFAAVAIMLVIRYVSLILALVLSPVAFMSFVLPDLKKYRDQWWSVLSGQAFFAPIYFVLTWVTVKILAGTMATITGSMATTGTTDGTARAALATLSSAGQVTASGAVGSTIDPGAVGMFLNFVVVIVFLIASLIISKDWSNKAGSGVASLNKWALGAAGGGTLGMAGRLGRNTIGRGLQAFGESETLKNARVRMVERGGLTGSIGGASIRLAQATAKKGGSSSFDLRGTGVGGTLEAGKAQKGGYEAQRKASVKSEEEYAKSQAPSEKTKTKARERYERAKKIYRDDKHPEVLKAKIELERIEGIKKDEVDKRKAEVIKRHNEILSNDPVIRRAQELELESKKKENELITNNPDLKKEKDLEEEVRKMEEEIKNTLVAELRDQRKEALELKREELNNTKKVNAAKQPLLEKEVEQIQNEAKEAQREAEVRKVTLDKDRESEVNNIKAIDSLADVRKNTHAQSVQDSYWAKFRGYNYEAAAQIRKGKKSAKELIDEVLKDTGEKKDDTETPKAEEEPKAT